MFKRIGRKSNVENGTVGIPMFKRITRNSNV